MEQLISTIPELIKQSYTNKEKALIAIEIAQGRTTEGAVREFMNAGIVFALLEIADNLYDLDVSVQNTHAY